MLNLQQDYFTVTGTLTFQCVRSEFDINFYCYKDVVLKFSIKVGKENSLHTGIVQCTVFNYKHHSLSIYKV